MLNDRWTSWHSVQLRPVGLVPEKYVAGILEWLHLYPFLCPAGALCACSEARFRAAFPGSVEPGNLPAVFAKVKAREDSLLSQQSAMCPVGVGSAPFGWGPVFSNAACVSSTSPPRSSTTFSSADTEASVPQRAQNAWTDK